MQTFLNRLHARVGDLWCYSAMIFIACRSGDVIQAFIGLWLVPKYVGPNELGAVLPLQQLKPSFQGSVKGFKLDYSAPAKDPKPAEEKKK